MFAKEPTNGYEASPGVITITVVSPAAWSSLDPSVRLEVVVPLIVVLGVEGRETVLTVGVILIVVLLGVYGRFQLTVGHSNKIFQLLVAVRH